MSTSEEQNEQQQQPEGESAMPPPPSYPSVMTHPSSYHVEEEGKRETGEATRVVQCVGLPSPAVVGGDSWHRGKSVLDCNRHMLELQKGCDIWFRVGEGNRQGEGERGGEGESQVETVGAHIYVLQSRSSGFLALLAAASGNHGNSVGVADDDADANAAGRCSFVEFHLPYTRPKVFWQLLKYLYYEEMCQDKDTVMELLTLAEKYDVVVVRDACLQFLRGCVADDTACALLELAHRHDDQKLGKECPHVLYIKKHGNEDMLSAVVPLLCGDCLNKVLTLEEQELTPTQKFDISNTRELHHDLGNHQNTTTTTTTTHGSPNYVTYVKKDLTQSHRFLLEGPLDRRERRRSSAADQENQPPPMLPERRSRSREPDPDSTSVASTGSDTLRNPRTSTRSNSSRGSVDRASTSLTRLPSFTAWPDLNQVTRFNEFSGSFTNTGIADAISFTVDRSIYLYGFGIYSNINPYDETSYKVDTILTCKKRDLVFESISINGVGTILPTMLETPVKLEKEKLYTLQIYLQGPPSHQGTAGLQTVEVGNVTFTFRKAPKSIKGNRTTVLSGQIPRLYYLPY